MLTRRKKKKLTKEQELTLRQLQTHFLTPQG